LTVLFLVISACQKKDDTPDPANCNGPGQVNVSGAVSGTYCLSEVTQYKFDDHMEISIVTNTGEQSVMLYIQLGYQGEGLNPGNGTYQVGEDNPAFVQVGFHGANEEFFNSTVGSVTVTQISASKFTASFSITAKGYYDGQTITATGSVNY